MLTLKDIMRNDVISVAPELSLRELLEVLTEAGVTGVPVVSDSHVVGVVSATDVLEFQYETPGVPVARGEVADNSKWAESNEEAEASPSEFFVEMWPPAEVDALERIRTTNAPEWDVLDEHTVAEVMNRKIISWPSSTSVQKAAANMLEAGIHRVLVVDERELRGIVTTMDVVRAVAEGKIKG